MLKDDYKIYEEKMNKSIDSAAADFASVRAGRANAAVLDRIMVDYYGTPTPIQQIAAISTPDPRILQISPWDGSALKSIEKAILNSDLGINPQNDGRNIRLNFPQLTEERRKELVKQIRKYAENGKVAIRNIRRDAMESFKKKEKASEITEDDLKQAEKDLQKLTDDSSKKIDELLARKEKEARKKQKVVEIKEIRLSPNIDSNDLNTKMNAAKKFLSKGDKVKITLRFRGREMAHMNASKHILDDFAASLGEIAVVEKAPKVEGRSISMVLAEKK